MKKLLFVAVLVLAGCSSPEPQGGSRPAPVSVQKNCIDIPGESCRKISAGTVGGTTLGGKDNEETVNESTR